MVKPRLSTCLGLPALLAACGPSVAPRTEAPARACATLAPAAPAPVSTAAQKTLVVLHAQAGLPTVEALEAAIARASRSVGVAERGRGIEVAGNGVRCMILAGERLDAAVMPAPQDGPDAPARVASTATAVVECKPEATTATEGALLAEVVATELVKLLDGQLYDPQAGRHWIRADWDAARSSKAFKTTRHVATVVLGSGERRYVATRGLVAFGRPDLAVFPVNVADVEALQEKLIVLADDLINGEPAGPGSALDLGPANMVLVDQAAFAAAFPPGTPGVTESVEGPTAARLVPCDPQGKLGDPSAVDRLVRHLTLP